MNSVRSDLPRDGAGSHDRTTHFRRSGVRLEPSACRTRRAAHHGTGVPATVGSYNSRHARRRPLEPAVAPAAARARRRGRTRRGVTSLALAAAIVAGVALAAAVGAGVAAVVLLPAATTFLPKLRLNPQAIAAH